MALTDLTRISTSGIATGSTIDAAILRKDVSFRGSQIGVTSSLFDSSENELKFNDNVKLKFGDGGDLQLYWTGSAGFVTNQGAAGSNLHFNSDTVLIKNAANSKSHIRAYNNSSVEIFYNNNKKIETTKHGAVVTGILTATSFSGPLIGSPINNPSGISTFYDLRVVNNLTVEGTTTTLDTNLIGVDRVEVGANSNTLAGIAVTQSGTADLVRLYDGASQVVTVDDVGRVGLGSAIPAARLDVSPTIQIKNTASNGNANLDINAANGGQARINLYAGVSGGANRATRIDFHNQGNTPQWTIGNDFAQNGTNYFSIRHGSENAIQCNPDATVSLYDDGDESLRTDAAGILVPEKVIHLGDTDTFMKFDTNTISFETAGSQHLRVASNGNIGIGTGNNNPTSKLHILVDGVGQGIHIANKENLYPTASTGYSDIRFSFRDYQSGGSSGAPAIIRGQSNNAGATSRSSKLIFLTSSSDGTNTPTEKMRIEHDGDVGIGTNNPLSGLHISDGTAYGSPQNSSRKATLTISAGSEGSSDIQLLSANYNHIFFGDSADPNTGIIWYEHTGGGTDSMNFTTAGTQKIKIDSSGNITNTGIATSFVTTQFAANFAKLDLRGTNIANSNHYILSYGAGHANNQEFHMVNTLGALVFSTG